MKRIEKTKNFFADLPNDIWSLISDSISLCEWSDSLNNLNLEKTVLVSMGMTSLEVVEKVKSQNIKHLLQKESLFLLDELKAAAKLIENPDLYFSNAGNAILSDVVGQKKFEFNSRKEKATLMKDIEDYLKPVVRPLVLENIFSIIEELYMNAIIDAPREHLKLGHNSTPYDEGKSAVFEISHNDERLIISCSDPIGSLQISSFINRLVDVCRDGAGPKMNFGAGGAGIGCMIMFEKSDAMYFGVKPGVQTCVTCCVPIKLNNRERESIKKSLHILS